MYAVGKSINALYLGDLQILYCPQNMPEKLVSPQTLIQATALGSKEAVCRCIALQACCDNERHSQTASLMFDPCSLVSVSHDYIAYIRITLSQEREYGCRQVCCKATLRNCVHIASNTDMPLTLYCIVMSSVRFNHTQSCHKWYKKKLC